MKNFILLTYLIFIFSCTSRLNGKIEQRIDNKDCYGLAENIDITISASEFKTKIHKSESVYLISTSLDKTYQFTIKEELIKNDSLIDKSTRQVELAPGAEEWIGCTKYSNAENEIILVKYYCTGQQLKRK